MNPFASYHFRKQCFPRRCSASSPGSRAISLFQAHHSKEFLLCRNVCIREGRTGFPAHIVTKSVSRFARNTVDSLTAVRKLKEHGTEVYFQKENIYTFDSKGELLITIMSSLAQEESRSISENVTWGQRKRFADGKVRLPYKSFLGYRKGADGLPEIVPEEAETVRLIYRLFIGGRTVNYIANHLTQSGIDNATVYVDERIIFRFKNGAEIEEKL